MRVGIATVVAPFIRGGAEIHAENLARAVREAGHEVEIIAMPFRFSPPGEIRRSMDIWKSENFALMNGYHLDVAICLKFPSFYLQHSNKVAWILHQYRSVYDLWETPAADELRSCPEGRALRQAIIESDNQAFLGCSKIFSNSANVARRLLRYNGISSQPLYHPPLLAERLYTAPAQPYVFFPSRMEDLKRQQLLIEAMRFVKTPVVALLAGDGGQRQRYERMIDDLGLSRRVRILGQISEDELLAFYAHSLAVFFGPKDEDLGYITLEAMLASKPVITCRDSGGPLDFVVDGETGLVVDPLPEAVAAAIDRLYLDPAAAARMGRAGCERYRQLGISWANVLDHLLN